MGFRDSIPAALQEIVQNGLLKGVFEDSLVPGLLYDAICDVEPWGGAIGTQSIMTRPGLIPVSTAPVTGGDAPTASYGFEQYSVKMDQFGLSIDTNMAVSAFALASKFLEDNERLGINAAQTINYLARNALYEGVYGAGTTWVTTASTDSTSLIVADASGFVNAVTTIAGQSGNTEGLNIPNTLELVPVSTTTPLNVTVNGVANTVTGVNVATNTLTLSAAISATVGWTVVSAIAPVSYRPNARGSANDLVAGDLATLSLFQSAATRLRNMNVPRINGAYTAHVAPSTVDELFQDNNFLLAYRGRGDSPAYTDFTVGSSMGTGGEFIGRFSGIDWVLNTVTPGVDTPLVNLGGVPYFRPIVIGQGAVIKAPFERMGDLVSTLNAGATTEVEMVNGVARVLRAPLDRFGQVLSSTWSWIGGYTAGTDLLTGDAAAYKRAVVVEHA